VDVVPEYLGTALTSVAPAAGVAMSDAVAVRRELAGALAPRGVHVLRPAAAQNQNALVVTGATAARLRLRTLSDLGPLAPRLVLGGPPECQQRPLCLPGLRRVYGLRFAGFMPLATGWQRVDALGRGVVDAVITGSTDGHLAGGDLVPLADDRGLQPAENVVPVIHAAAEARYGPGLAGALDAVSARLTTDDLILLNRRITVAGRNVLAEARTWLERQGILPEPG
jgi:osmoprotectant transport system substrate-binding protein